MRKVLLTVALLASLPGLSFAQDYVDCPGCEFGIFEDTGMTKNFGDWHPDLGMPATLVKTIYLGVKFDQGLVGLTTIEMSVSGLPVDPILNPPNMLVQNGPNIEIFRNFGMTPADTVNGDGGLSVAWPSCVPGTGAPTVLIRIRLTSTIPPDPIPDDIVIRIFRRVPPQAPGTPYAHFTQCNNPAFTKTRPSLGCYVLNPTVGLGESVGDPPCTLKSTGVTSETWSGIKLLYR